MTGQRRRKLIRWLLTLTLAPPAVVVMFHWFEHSQVFHPYRRLTMRPSDFGRPFEEVVFAASDGVRLHGWFFPGPTNSARARRGVLYCHGNAGNISTRPDYYLAILETGVSLFTFDFRGYGNSKGRVNEAGTYLDTQAAYRWLKQRGFAPADIIIWGESLGGGIGSELAVREPVGGLVLQSSFTSVPDLGAEIFPWLPVRWIGRIKYDTHARLPRIHCPVLIMHSRADSLIPFRHAEGNFTAANEPKLLWELQGDHNEAVDTDRSRYVQGFEEFLGLMERRTEPLRPQ
jgi:hypothetical protein